MKKVAATTLGCKVNQYDTQSMLEDFLKAGYEIVDFSQAADIYIVNTCTVTATADRKSRQMIHRAKQNAGALVIVCGCMAQSEAEQVLGLGADIVIGTDRRSDIVKLVREHVTGKPLSSVESLENTPYEPMHVSGSLGHTRAYMKIQEGCNCFCTYCIIPHVRGRSRSRSLADIGAEAVLLRSNGYKEIVLTGINLSSYGLDIPGKPGLSDAVKAVLDSGIARVRLGSLDPGSLDSGLIDMAANDPRVCPHFHISLQSGCAATLKVMGRRYTPQEYRREVEEIRRKISDAAVTTDVMVGFPGETDEDFAESLAFVESIAFSRIHVFPYSRREGTLAAAMPNQISRKIKAQRSSEMIKLGQMLEESYARSLLGRREIVLAEDKLDGGMIEGYNDKYVRVRFTGNKSDIGEFVAVRITGNSGGVALADQIETEW